MVLEVNDSSGGLHNGSRLYVGATCGLSAKPPSGAKKLLVGKPGLASCRSESTAPQNLPLISLMAEYIRPLLLSILTMHGDGY